MELNDRMMCEYNLSEGAAFLSSLIWESLGWTQCPPHRPFTVPPEVKIKFPRVHRVTEKYNLTFQKALEPKVYLSDYCWQEEIPKRIIIDKLKKELSKIDHKKVIEDLKIDPKYLRPRKVVFRNSVVVFKPEYTAGIPTFPYLDLELFDNKLLEIRSPEDWLSTGQKGNVKKPVPAIAYLPEKYRSADGVKFQWQDVVVLSYSTENEKFLVRRKCDCPQEGGKMQITLKALEKLPVGEFTDIYLPRIYICFASEDPVLYGQRLASVINDRHKVQESLRFSFYVDCMPLSDVPYAPPNFMNRIRALAINQFPEDYIPEWEKEKIEKYCEEVQLIYRRFINYEVYQEVTNQRPCLWSEVPEGCTNSKSPRFGYKLRVAYSFQEKYESFEKNSYFCKEIVKVLLAVQEQILILLERQLYCIPLTKSLPIDEFIALHKRRMSGTKEFIHKEWIKTVINCIRNELQIFTKGHYNLRETSYYAYGQSKLKKLLKTISLKIVDTTRTIVITGLRDYTKLFEDACHSVMKVGETYVWSESFDSTVMAPLSKPLFQVEAIVKGPQVDFSFDLEKCRTLLIDLFNDALDVTTSISHPEISLMEKLLIEDDILQSVSHLEEQVKVWRNLVVTGLDKAIIAINAYRDLFQSALTNLDTDPINYVKEHERQKIQYDELRALIEFHMSEKACLSEKIPDSVEIGPFHFITKTVKRVAVKKHETLANSLLKYFATKLQAHMGDIAHEFNSLQEQITQPAGNIEDLLQQIIWLETVTDTIGVLTVSVSDLRQDFKLMAGFYRGFENEEFSLYWEVLGLPYRTEVILSERISGLDGEKEELRSLLEQDHDDLKENVKELATKLQDVIQLRNVEKSVEFQRQIRLMKRELTTSMERARIYNMREGLFELPKTNYQQIREISHQLEPYDVLWTAIGNFYKWRERDATDLAHQIDQNELFKSMEESYSKLNSCLELFRDQVDIMRIILKVREEMDKYRLARFEIEIPDHDDDEI